MSDTPLSFDDDQPDFRCSIISSAQDTEAKPIGFRDALSGIRTGRWAAKVEAVRAAYEKGGKEQATEPKKRLPGILFSGTFSKRAASALTQHSGLICIDLDGLGDRAEAIKEQISADPHTLAAFISPTGSGLKVIYRVDPAKPHAESFKAAEHHTLTQFGLNIDPACKDVSRICFVSHDPELFAADDATPLPYPEAPPTEYRPAGLANYDSKPGDDYDARHDLPALLATHGWKKCSGGFTRAGKDSGVSATFDKVPGRFYVFSSSTQFQANHVYRPWHVYAILEHGGDYSAAARELGKKGYGESRQHQNLDRLAGPAPKGLPQRKPSEFRLLPANDSSSLLGNRYLNRGDGLVLSGPSGCGKSSMQTQMAARWALGKDFHGIKPAQSIRSLIIQSEDSDGDIAEVWASLHHVLAHTPAEVQALDERVRIVTDRVNRGQAFIAALKAHVAEFKPDLVWINPLQAFIDGDVTQSKDIGKFLREGLNGLNDPAKFGYALVHHTTKPATGKDRHERLWHEVMYDMAGGAEIINWARAILSLRPLENPGEFSLRLAKRGRRAGVTKEVEQGAGTRQEPVTEIGIRHSQGHLQQGHPIIYWEAMELPDKEEKKGKSTGREEKYLFTDFRSVLPKKSEPGRPFNQILQACHNQAGGIPRGSLQSVLKRWQRGGDIQFITPESGPTLFRCAL